MVVQRKDQNEVEFSSVSVKTGDPNASSIAKTQSFKHYKTMAPTEESILRSFLLSKSGLRDVVTLSEFTSFFPPSKRSSPLVRQLYRDLQGQRNAICESVSKQINMECRMGARLIASRRATRADVNGSGEEGGMEAHVSLELVKMLMRSSY